jgi:hypothetical protein
MAGDEVWIGDEHLGVLMGDANKWQRINDDTDRLRVPGGFLYRACATGGGQDLLVTSVALAFVPDASDPTPKKRLVIKRR